MLKIVRLIAFVFLLYAPVANSATLYIDPGVSTLFRGDAIVTSVRIMPDSQNGECINTIDAVVTYTENIQPVDVSIGKSIFSVWVEPPVINKENRTITFAGGIPNGYCGRVEGDPRLTNIVAEIVFRSPGMQVGGSDDNQVRVDFAPETRVLLNDGQGTQAQLASLGATFTLEKGAAAGGIVDNWRESVTDDSVPPEKFSIELTKDPEGIYFNGKNFIVFTTTDKQTGISEYEVMEEPVLEFSEFTWGGVGGRWIKTQSPYVLEDQSLNSIIHVKAIDKAGNEYIATYVPDESQQTLSKNQLYTYILLSTLILLFVVILIVVVIVVKRRRQKNNQDTENEEDFEDDSDTDE
jgi:hypothetical protein